MTGQPRGRDEEDEKKKTCVIYARVSAQKQAKAGNLVRQVERLHKYAWDHQLTVVDVVTDIGSGMSETRKGLTKLFKYTQEQKMAYLLIEFRWLPVYPGTFSVTRGSHPYQRSGRANSG